MPNSIVMLIAVLWLPSPQSAPPAQNCRPVKGTFIAHVVKEQCPPGGLCTSGAVSGDLAGDYVFHVTKPPMPAGDPAPPSIQFFVGESIVRLENGRTLSGTDTGTIDMPPGLGGFASLITWKDGGQIRLRGTLDTIAGTTSGDYQGTVCGAR